MKRFSVRQSRRAAATRHPRLTADYGPADDSVSFFHVLRRVREIQMVVEAAVLVPTSTTMSIPVVALANSDSGDVRGVNIECALLLRQVCTRRDR